MTALDLVLAAPGRVSVREVPDTPPAPGPGEALVEVDCVSLCGSDLRNFLGTYHGPGRYPIRFGHEWAGRVLAAGTGAELVAGTPVTGDCSRWCGTCDRCRVDRNLCRAIEKFGLTVDGFSTRRRVVAAKYLYPDPYGLDPRLRALSEPLAVAMHGMDRISAIDQVESVLIVGCGAIGFCCALLARYRYAVPQVCVADVNPDRLELVRRTLPAVEVVDGAISAEVDTYQAISESARYPLVIECAGTTAALRTALTAADFRAQVLCLGLGGHADSTMGLVVAKGLHLHGSIGGTGSFPEALELLHSHQVQARALLGRSFPAHDSAAAFATAIDVPAHLKVQIIFS